jgi:hypothetical protein
MCPHDVPSQVSNNDDQATVARLVVAEGELADARCRRPVNTPQVVPWCIAAPQEAVGF